MTSKGMCAALASAIVLLAAAHADPGSGGGGTAPIICNNKCRMRLEHVFASGTCVRFQLADCLLCVGAGRCEDLGDHSWWTSECSSTGGNLVDHFSSCNAKCLTGEPREATMTGLITATYAAEHHECVW